MYPNIENKWIWDVADGVQVRAETEPGPRDYLPPWYRRLALAVLEDALRDYQAGKKKLPPTTHYKNHKDLSKQAQKWLMSIDDDYFLSFAFIARVVLMTDPNILRREILSTRTKMATELHRVIDRCKVREVA